MLDAKIQAAAPGADQLLAELPEILRQLPEVDATATPRPRTTTGPTIPAEVRNRRATTSSQAFEMMNAGPSQRLHLPGLQPAAGLPRQGQDPRGALSKLKYLVVMDPLDTETAKFWHNDGPQNPSDPATIQTEVFQLPTTCFAEEDGSLVNSARWLQWHWKAAEPARRSAGPTSGSWPSIFHRCGRCTQPRAARFPDPILELTWNYTNPDEPDPEEMAKEMNGRALADLKDASGAVTAQGGPAARRLRAIARRRHRPRAAAGSSPAATPRRATRWRGATPAIRANRASRRTGRGRGRPTGAFSTIAPARDPAGKAWNPRKPVIEWNGTQWAGIDVPDYRGRRRSRPTASAPSS